MVCQDNDVSNERLKLENKNIENLRICMEL